MDILYILKSKLNSLLFKNHTDILYILKNHTDILYILKYILPYILRNY